MVTHPHFHAGVEELLHISDQTMHRVPASSPRDNHNDLPVGDLQEQWLPKVAVQTVNVDFPWSELDGIAPEAELVYPSAKRRRDEPVKRFLRQRLAEPQQHWRADKKIFLCAAHHASLLDALPRGLLCGLSGLLVDSQHEANVLSVVREAVAAIEFTSDRTQGSISFDSSQV